MKNILSITLFLLAPVIAHAVDLNIPERFQGVWAQDKNRCKSIGESYFEIEQSKVIGYESVGIVKAVYVRANEIALIEVISGEGETWLSTELFELSESGQVLIDKRAYPHVKRYKCP